MSEDKKLDYDELNNLFIDGENADRTVFADMRTNVLLESGVHHQRAQDRFLQRVRDSKLSENTKLRLTSNHIQVVTKTYRNGIVSQAPGVQFMPFNENELRDQKEAELSQAIWQDAEIKQRIEEKIDLWASSFVGIGECVSFHYFDPNKGKLLGYKQEENDEGQPMFKDTAGKPSTDACCPMTGVQHEMMQSDDPVYEGELVIEPVLPFNLIRPKNCESLHEAEWLCIRKMMSLKEAEALVDGLPDEEEKKKFIRESGNTTFKIFDPTSGEYNDGKDQCLIKQFFFRPCHRFPEGWFAICAEGVLFEGPLPFGIFPLVTEGFDLHPTSPRASSIIKPIRGPQANINMLLSKKFEHIITMSDDKVFTPVGSKISKGSQWAGIREFNISGGMAPTVLPGRSGDQFEASIAQQVEELYKLANLDYELAENQSGGVQDPFAQLYKSLAQRKKYAIYVKKFERFLCNMASTHMRLAKRYLPDDYIVRAVGKREAVNIPEFKQIADEGFNIKLKPMSSDIESMAGKHLSITTAMQYLGKDLPTNVKGKLLRVMPFLNEDQAFSDLTLDEDNVTNDLLAMDRGEPTQAKEIDKHELYIERINNRQKQADFKMLPPQVQMAYEQRLQQHIQFAAKQAADLKAAEQGFIPSSGGLIKCDLYGENGKRIVLPQESVQWLITMLEKQGSAQKALQQLNEQNQVQILQAAHSISSQQPMQAPQQNYGMSPSPAGLMVK